jgi:hypothetical protein
MRPKTQSFKRQQRRDNTICSKLEVNSACKKTGAPVMEIPAAPYTLTYPLVLKWTAPEGDDRPLEYIVVRNIKGQSNRSKRRFFAPTSNTQLRLLRNPATKKYQVVTYQVYARASCETVYKRPSVEMKGKKLS